MNRLFFASVAISLIAAAAWLPSPAEASDNLPVTIGDPDGFGMGSGGSSLLNTYINVHPLYSANIDTPGDSPVDNCEDSTYLPFKFGYDITHYLRDGDYLPDTDSYCFDNGTHNYIPFPLSNAPDTFRMVSCADNEGTPTAGYQRGYDVTQYNPPNDCWDNRSAAETTTNGAKYTDITLSTAFTDWPNLTPNPTGVPTFSFTINYTNIPWGGYSNEPVYIYVPIGDIDADSNAHIEVTANGNTVSYPLMMQDNSSQQGLIQGVVVPLYKYNGTGFLFKNWNQSPQPFVSYLSGTSWRCTLTVKVDLGYDPYYAIDYVAVTDDLSSYGVRLVPQTYATIQAAIDAANDHDRIIVSGGENDNVVTYTQAINFNGKNISLVSQPNLTVPVIESPSATAAVTFSGTEDVTANINGFIIKNNNTGGVGIEANKCLAGIQNCTICDTKAGGLRNPNGYIADCIFKGNTGGAVYVNEGTPRFVRCDFGISATETNSINSYGGAFRCGTTSTSTAPTIARFDNCQFFGNSSVNGGGAGYIPGYSATLCAKVYMTNCLFWKNSASQPSMGYGGALRVANHATLTVTNCTFAMNSTVAPNGGGAIYVNGSPGKMAYYNVYNSLFWGDTSGTDPNITTSEIKTGIYKTPSLKYDIIEGAAQEDANFIYGDGYDPRYVDDEPASGAPDLRPGNEDVGNIGETGYYDQAENVTFDFDYYFRPLDANDTKKDLGAYEVFSTEQ